MKISNLVKLFNKHVSKHQGIMVPTLANELSNFLANKNQFINVED